jgi:hypothetical protein
MKLRQLFLIAGTIVLAACPGNSSFNPCESNDETGESYCPNRPTLNQDAPATSVDTGEPQ